MDNAFPIIKHNQQHLNLWPTHPCFFWSRRPFAYPLRRFHLGFNITPVNPRLISCHDVLKKGFVTISIGNQFLTDFNTVLFLIVNKRGTNFALKRRIWSFSLKILWQDPMVMPTSSATSRAVKDDFHESQYELSRHGRRLLMWKLVQAWDLHRPTFCPL